jgi:hypothetical protein
MLIKYTLNTFISLIFITLSSVFNSTAQNTFQDNVGLDAVNMHYDFRIDSLIAIKNSRISNISNSGSHTGVIKSARGYRILIYSGTDRAKSSAVKTDFMRKYPGTRIYTGYAQPQYRVKVGDFTSRAEANELYNKLNKVYSPCMIVPDIIELNTFKKNETNN